jgi:hypothetical protein
MAILDRRVCLVGLFSRLLIRAGQDADALDYLNARAVVAEIDRDAQGLAITLARQLGAQVIDVAEGAGRGQSATAF